MAAITWNDTGKHFYETGVDRGVVYPHGGTPAPWIGLASVAENPTGAEPTPIYADNTKYLNLMSNEEFGATIEAYTYPDAFAECDGSAAVEGVAGVYLGQQARKPFDFCYRTILGNDEKFNEHGYKLHLIYNCLASPSSRSYSSVNENIEPGTFSWDLTTTPVPVTGHKHTATIVIDSTKVTAEALKKLEDMLYGANSTPKMPTPDELIALMKPTAQKQ